MTNSVSVKNLIKQYKNVRAVDSISFEVKPKEIFALIGPNGAGKSTTLRILATVISPTGGKAEIYGFDVKKQPNEVRKMIAYLPEEAGAYKNMKGVEYLRFMAAIYSDNPMRQKEYVDFASEITELKDRLKDKVNTYSKGMARKLLLARTVMSSPKLAILDEPTSGLDVENALFIRSKIRDLSKQGMAVLLSSHNMLEIEFLSDRVGIINKGKIIEIGTPSSLKKEYKSTNLEEVFVSITHLESKKG